MFLRIVRYYPLQVKFKASLVDFSGVERFANQFDHVFEKYEGQGWSKFLTRDQLLKPENALLNDDTLILSIEVI